MLHWGLNCNGVFLLNVTLGADYNGVFVKCYTGNQIAMGSFRNGTLRGLIAVGSF